MSIAGEISRIKDNIASAYEGLEALDAAIPQQRNSDNLRTAIDSIPPDGPRLAAVFYDCDGTVTNAYTKVSVNSLTELPEPPYHNGLSFVGWNMTLGEIKSAVTAFGKRVNIGARYITADGKSRLYIKLENGESDFSLRVTQPYANSVEIDWGDGSPPETFAAPIRSYSGKSIYGTTHTYSPASYPAEYTVTLSPTDSGGYGFGPVSVSSGTAIRRIETGEHVSIDENAFSGLSELRCIAWDHPYAHRNIFSGCHSLSYVTLGRYIGQYAFFDCIHLESISASYDCGNIGYGAFHNCINLKYAGVFPSCTAIDDSAFDWCYSLKEIGGFPDCEAVGTNAFANCINLDKIIPAAEIRTSAFANNYTRRRLVIPAEVRTIYGGAFTDQRMLREIDLTDYTDPCALPVLTESFSRVFTTNEYDNIGTVRFYVANEEMKNAFSNATNWSEGAEYFVVGNSTDT